MQPMNTALRSDILPPSASIAGFAAAFDPAAIPAPVLHHAKLCILDATGIALAAADYPFAHSAIAAATLLGGDGQAPVIGHSTRLPLRDAVLANGTLIHGLDFDDTHSASVVHCSASAWPVAFGGTLDAGGSGLDALAAYVLAVEVDAAIGSVAEGRLQRRGFHPTGIVGAFGCAAAAARIRELTAAQHLNALGIVLSMASGSMAFIADGAWTKRLHPGWAGVAGLTAAALAASGYVGPQAPLEGPFGLYATLLDDTDSLPLNDLATNLGQTWSTPDIAFKPYPACHFNHAFADCALALKDRYALEPADIDTVTALIHPDEVAVVCEPLSAKQQPDNAYEAQFSVPWIVAACLVHGRFTLDELEPPALADTATRALAARVGWQADPDSLYPQSYSGSLIIRTRDGRTLRHDEPINRGAAGNPMTAAAIREKYFANATRRTSHARAQEIADMVLSLEHAGSLDALAAALTCGD